jgi:predicted membrane channel-forming protein YqfA (hemolysin III family)
MGSPVLPYSRAEELAHSLTAGLGIVACFVAIPWLVWVSRDDGSRLAAALAFGLSALAMFVTSVIYH